MSILPVYCLLMVSAATAAAEKAETQTVFRPVATADPTTHALECQKFIIPLQVHQAEKQAIREVVFYVSNDQGKKWRKFESVSPKETGLIFVAPEPGLYWFAVQVIYKDRRPAEPEHVDDLQVAKKVRVQFSPAPPALVEKPVIVS
jgi:hypothetical protein